MNLRVVWSFIAGDSRLAPLGVALAVGAVLVLRHVDAVGAVAVGVLYVGIIAAGLVAGVFEKV